mmetsp:Transcript_16094/g.54685  ORF Transcript_16094/g.54685 Transcript_16094/m.54685 type:complete len:226 (-) Transcript_16094:44-721(-)
MLRGKWLLALEESNEDRGQQKNVAPDDHELGERDQASIARLGAKVLVGDGLIGEAEEPRLRHERAQQLANGVHGRRIGHVLGGQHGESPAVHRHVLRCHEEIQRHEENGERADVHRVVLLPNPVVHVRRREYQGAAHGQLDRDQPGLAPSEALDKDGVHEGRPQDLEAERQGHERESGLMGPRDLLHQNDGNAGGQSHRYALQRVQEQQDTQAPRLALQTVPGSF